MAVLSNLHERFDKHLAQAENVRSLFVALNDEVFQCAVDMSDAVLDQQSSQLAFTPEQDAAWKPTFDKACEAIVEMWSADIVSQLRTEVAKGDTILFECLVQNVLVAHCEDIVGTFSPERPELDRYMKGLWKEVMDSRRPLKHPPQCR